MTSKSPPRAWHKEKKIMLQVKVICWGDECVNSHISGRSLKGKSKVSDMVLYFHEVALLWPTGLKDKKGREIYGAKKPGGDILKLDAALESEAVLAPVICENGAFWCDGDLLYDVAEESEIVGNVHENPDLLKET